MDFYIFLSVLLLSSIFAPILQKLFLKLNKVDSINQRSSHTGVATRTGGATSFITIFIISLYWYVIGIEPYDFSILIPISIMVIIGVYDDFYNADFKLKFFIQIIAAKMIIDQGFIIDDFYGVLWLNEIPRIGAQIFTVFVFLIIVNSINFIDGIDGIAIVEFIKIIFFIEFFNSGNSVLIIIGFITIISLLPLLFYNHKKHNKIFLGDAGSLFLGTILAIYTFYLLGPNYKMAIEFNKPLLSILILLYPLTDLLRVFIIRVKNKKSPFQPDNNHLHHILLDKGFSHWKISIILPIGFLILSMGIIFLLK